MFDIQTKVISGNFDSIHFTNIHKYIFEDIFHFAGSFRTENISNRDICYLIKELIKLSNIKTIKLIMDFPDEPDKKGISQILKLYELI